MPKHYNNNYDILYGYGNTPAYPLNRDYAFEANKQSSAREIRQSKRKNLELIVLDLPMENDDYASYGSGGPAQAYTQAG